MGREIERKFLIDTAQLTPDALGRGVHITQGYLSFAPSVRVRLSRTADGSETGYLTVKGPGRLARAEFEYPVPAADAAEMLDLCAARLSKTRYRVTIGAHVWEIDAFEGPHAGLWLAEIELKSEDEAFERPAWALTEVTDDARYANGALARAGRAP